MPKLVYHQEQTPFPPFRMEMHTLYNQEIKKQMEYMNQIKGLAPAALVKSLLKMNALNADPTF